jgi:uncharacterized protein (UPF0276 family)
VLHPSAGIGFKPEHFEAAADCAAEGLWFEIHAENYMVDGGPRLAMLDALRERHELSIHGVGLSLAGAEDIDADHLARLKRLVERIEPMLVSEHLAWSRIGVTHLPDLLPIPRTKEALHRLARSIERTQQALGRRISIENPAHYLPLPGHEWDEPEFLGELARRTGCGLLIDVNNIFVAANNLGYCAHRYIDALPVAPIEEIHIAGHRPDALHGETLLIDSHDAPVAAPVWTLLDHLLARKASPVLLERDGDIPSFEDLLHERNRAARAIDYISETVDAL